MLVIHKFSLKPRAGTNTVSVEMPIGAQILSIQLQDNLAQIWAMVDPYAVKEVRRFFVYETGEMVPDPEAKQHLATLVYGGTRYYVIHVFAQKG